MINILIIEDNDFIRDGLNSIFTNSDYTPLLCSNLASARTTLQTVTPDLAILDVLLPDGNGFDFCKELRTKYDFPILFLTCCEEEYNVVRGLDAGGDDYVTKPFRVQELLSRTRALLRRRGARTATPVTTYSCGDVTLDVEKRCVYISGALVTFTPNEFQILYKLLVNKGIVVTRQKLLEDIWDSDGRFIDDNTLSVHVSSIRKKLADAKLTINTIRSVGYRIEE